MASNFFNSPLRTFVFDSTGNDSNQVANQYLVVKLVTGTVNHVSLATSATDPIVGTLNNGPKSTDVADVVLSNAQGSYLVSAGGTIAIGDLLTVDSTSRALTTTTTGNVCFGRALQAASAGDVFEYEPIFLIHA